MTLKFIALSLAVSLSAFCAQAQTNEILKLPVFNNQPIEVKKVSENNEKTVYKVMVEVALDTVDVHIVVHPNQYLSIYPEFIDFGNVYDDDLNYAKNVFNYTDNQPTRIFASAGVNINTGRLRYARMTNQHTRSTSVKIKFRQTLVDCHAYYPFAFDKDGSPYYCNLNTETKLPLNLNDPNGPSVYAGLPRARDYGYGYIEYHPNGALKTLPSRDIQVLVKAGSQESIAVSGFIELNETGQYVSHEPGPIQSWAQPPGAPFQIQAFPNVSFALRNLYDEWFILEKHLVLENNYVKLSVDPHGAVMWKAPFDQMVFQELKGYAHDSYSKTIINYTDNLPARIYFGASVDTTSGKLRYAWFINQDPSNLSIKMKFKNTMIDCISYMMVEFNSNEEPFFCGLNTLQTIPYDLNDPSGKTYEAGLQSDRYYGFGQIEYHPNGKLKMFPTAKKITLVSASSGNPVEVEGCIELNDQGKYVGQCKDSNKR